MEGKGLLRGPVLIARQREKPSLCLAFSSSSLRILYVADSVWDVKMS